MSKQARSTDASHIAAAIALTTAIFVAGLTGSPAMAESWQDEKRYDLSCGENCDVRFSTDRLLELRHDQPDIRIRFGGRFHVDGAWIAPDVTPMASDFRIRRARPEVRGRLFDVFKFNVGYEFAPDRQGWRNLWALYAPTESIWLKGGNFVAPFGLEDRDSSNHTVFMERSLTSALSVGFQTGASMGFAGKLGRSKQRNLFTLALMGGIQPLASGEDDKHKSSHWGLATRATWAPLARRRRVVHLGMSVAYQNLETGSPYRVATRPESSIASALISTGRLPDVKEVVSVGVEAAGIYKSLSFQAEYMNSILLRSNALAKVDLWGAYGQVAWILTGEHRRYSRKGGRIKGPVPKRALGAIELAVRVSHLDLTDSDVIGGRETDFTVGLNWYMRQNLRFMLNYVYADARLRGTLETDRPQIVQGRLALFF